MRSNKRGNRLSGREYVMRFNLKIEISLLEFEQGEGVPMYNDTPS